MSSSSQQATTSSTLPKMMGAEALRDIVMEAAVLDATQASLDVNGIVWLEHINLVVGSKPLAQRFYIDLLGCTPDKSSSFHVNLGQQQFHLGETGDPAQCVTGSIGLAVPHIATIRERIETALQQQADDWKNTKLQIVDVNDSGTCMTIICPWGNRMHLYDVTAEQASLEPTSKSPQKMVQLHADGGTYAAGRMAVRGQPGIRFLELKCRPGTTPAIAQFYQELLQCTVTQPSCAPDGPACICVSVGPGVHLVFVEDDQLSEEDEAAMRGVHICIYASQFQQLYDKVSQHGIIWTNPRFTHLDSCDTWEEALASRTLRFKDITDLSSGSDKERTKILELEHETRPLRHGQFFKVPFYEPK